ncbi:MAG: HYR domain-containing protein [bacterium]
MKKMLVAALRMPLGIGLLGLLIAVMTICPHKARAQSSPPEDITELNAASWAAWGEETTTVEVADDTTLKLIGNSSLRFITDGGTCMRYPGTIAADWDLTRFTHLAISFLAHNSHSFQSGSPWIRLKSDDNNYFEYRYYQGGIPCDLLDEAVNAWRSYRIPLYASGTSNNGWRRIAVGTPTLAQVRYLEIHADTWDFGFTLWIDGAGFKTMLALPEGQMAVALNHAVSVSWQPVGDPAGQFDHYAIYRSTSPFTSVKGMVPIGTVSNVQTGDYLDNTAARGTGYYYAVAAVSREGKQDNDITDIASIGPRTPRDETDLQVIAISRTPRYPRYVPTYAVHEITEPSGFGPYIFTAATGLVPEQDANTQRWPNIGDPVTYTATVRNRGTNTWNSNTQGTWYIDGSAVEQTSQKLVLQPGQTAFFSHLFPWDGQLHEIGFRLKTADSRSANNELTIDSKSVPILCCIDTSYLEQFREDTPQYLHAVTDDFIDWLNNQAAHLNTLFTEAGCQKQVHYDWIEVLNDRAADPAIDGLPFLIFPLRFYAGGENFREYSSYYYRPDEDINYGFLQEIGHQLGLISLSQLDVPGGANQVSGLSYSGPQGLMNGCSPFISRHSALAMNHWLDKAQGYWGQYMYNLPAQMRLRILDVQGQPLQGATVRMYQYCERPGQGKVITDQIKAQGVTDAQGEFILPNVSVDPAKVPPTFAGDVLRDNPFGYLDVLGRNAVLHFRVEYGGSVDYAWLDAAEANIAYFAGQTGTATFVRTLELDGPTQGQPPLDMTELNAADWIAWAGDYLKAEVADDPNTRLIGNASLKFTTDGGFDTCLRYPYHITANWDLTQFTHLAVSFLALNPDYFYGGSPLILLKDDDNNYFEYQYYKDGWPYDLLNDARGAFRRCKIPLDASSTEKNGWRRTTFGTPDITRIKCLEIHARAGSGFSFWIDGAGFGTWDEGHDVYPQESIQTVIDVAHNGDVITVHPGIYRENIHFMGKAITLKSTDPNDPNVVAATVLDGNQAARVVTFDDGAGSSPVLTGFTVRNGKADYGGGISCSSLSPFITHCIIAGNSAVRGGGIICDLSLPTISHCIIYNNSAVEGGGISCESYSFPLITNCTISGNSAIDGSGMYCSYLSSPYVVNSILWNNGSEISAEISADEASHPKLSYCCLRGGYAGLGNMSANPLFVDPAHGDYRLRSGSPCIDAGHPRRYDGDASRSDIGAYGGEGGLSPDQATITVAADGSGNYALIQDAVDYAIEGDTIIVSPGTYRGNIVIGGKSISLMSQPGMDPPVIEGSGTGFVFMVIKAGLKGRLKGFIIQNKSSADPENDFSGGVWCESSSWAITDCIFKDNSFGIGCFDSSSTIADCTIRGNSSTGYGVGILCEALIAASSPARPTIMNCIIRENATGIECYSSSPVITNCIIYGNSTAASTEYGYGGGIVCGYGSSPVITNCTISGNSSAEENGGGIVCSGYNSSPVITNSILWGNSPYEMYIEYDSPDADRAVVTYCDVRGGCDGAGNIDQNPLFFDPNAGDYRLRPGSPCIDAGSNQGSQDIDGLTRPQDGNNDGMALWDMGAYEFTTSTTKDVIPPIITCPADMTVPAAGPLTIVTYSASATATDDTDPDPIIVYSPASGSEFSPGTRWVSVTATDSSGNSSTCTFKVTVVDITPPQIICPSAITINHTISATVNTVNLAYPTVFDACDPNPRVTNNAPAVFPPGKTAVTWTVIDASGNFSSCTQAVTVVDTTPPMVSHCPSDITAYNDPGKQGAAITWIPPTFTDNWRIASVTSTHKPGDFFPIGNTIVTYTAQDDNGNNATCSFTVTVAPDNESPAVSITGVTGSQSDLRLAGNYGYWNADEAVFWNTGKIVISYEVSDNCDPQPAITFAVEREGEIKDTGTLNTGMKTITIDPSGLTGKVKVTVTAKDASTRSASASTEFTVILLVPEENVTIRPAQFLKNYGLFTASVEFPVPYEAHTISDAKCDGAPLLRMNANVYGNNTVALNFRRRQIAVLPVDSNFVLRGILNYNGKPVYFQSSRKIRWVRQGRELRRQGLRRQNLRRQGLKRQDLRRQGLRRQGLKRQDLRRQVMRPAAIDKIETVLEAEKSCNCLINIEVTPTFRIALLEPVRKILEGRITVCAEPTFRIGF